MEAQTLLLVTALGLAVYWIVDHFYKHFTYWQSQGVPSHRFLTFGWMGKPFFQFATEQRAHFGCKIYGGYEPFTKILVITDARVARDLSTKQFHKFTIRNSHFYQGKTNICKSLFFMDANEDWKRIRSIVTPAFTSGKLRRMMSPIERISNNFVEHLRKEAVSGQEFDLKKYIGGFAMDVIACCGYGIEIDSVSVPDHPIVVNAKKILNVDVTLGRAIAFMFPRIAQLLDVEPFDKDAILYFDKLTFEIVEKRLAQKDAQQNHDFLGLMIEESQDGSNNPSQKLKGISKDEMSGQGILFFIAGFDTTHATFDHIIYYLSKYPEWQERLYQELIEHRDELDYEKFKQLPVLNAIIDETLRLNPPLVMIQRESVEDCELLDTGIKIPKNTLISIQPYVIHRDPDYFPDPLAFKPERFLDKSQALESNFAYMPFGAGPRLCVGMRFAQNELRIGLAHFLLNYKVSMDPNFKLEYFTGSILMSPKEVKVRVSER